MAARAEKGSGDGLDGILNRGTNNYCKVQQIRSAWRGIVGKLSFVCTGPEEGLLTQAEFVVAERKQS